MISIFNSRDWTRARRNGTKSRYAPFQGIPGLDSQHPAMVRQTVPPKRRAEDNMHLPPRGQVQRIVCAGAAGATPTHINFLDSIAVRKGQPTPGGGAISPHTRHKPVPLHGYGTIVDGHVNLRHWKMMEKFWESWSWVWWNLVVKCDLQKWMSFQVPFQKYSFLLQSYKSTYDSGWNWQALILVSQVMKAN